MNRRIIGSLLAIVSAVALMGSSTFAFFSNAGTSTNNVFSSGTLDLKLANGAGSLSDTVTASFGGTGMAPNECLDTATLNLKNSGSVAANHVDISAANSNSALAAFLRLSTFTLDGADLTVADSNANGFRDLQDFAVSGVINKPLTDFNVHPLLMQVCLDGSAGNAQQGQSSTLDLTILLDQGPP